MNTKRVDLTELQLDAVIIAMRDQYTPERARDPMASIPADALRELDRVKAEFESDRNRRADLVASLTEEEIDHILSRRKDQ